MSTHPRLEARVSALERRQINLEAHVEELSDDIIISVERLYNDMTASFKQVVAYDIQIEEQIDTRFNKIETRLDKIEATMVTKAEMAGVKEELKAEMAGVKEDLKNDMTAMEGRILNAFNQLLTTISPLQ